MGVFSYNPKKLDPSTRLMEDTEPICHRTVSDFWQWGFSDLLQNTIRGVLAEYIVAVLLGIDDNPRNPWLAYDLKLPDGRLIEVKTMSRLQAWAQKKIYVPRVTIKPTREWNPQTGEMKEKPTFNADIYIICYFNAVDHEKADPLNLNQWEFFVFTKEQIKKILGEMKTISLDHIKRQKIKAVNANKLKHEVMQLNS